MIVQNVKGQNGLAWMGYCRSVVVQTDTAIAELLRKRKNQVWCAPLSGGCRIQLVQHSNDEL